MQTSQSPVTLPSMLLLAILATGLNACSTQSRPEADSGNTSDYGFHNKDKKAIRTAPGYSKPGAPVSLQHGDNAVDAAGSATAVTFTLSTSSGIKAVNVSLNGEQLTIAGTGLIAVGDMAAGTSQELTAIVTPTAIGRQYLSVIVTGENDGNSTGRAFSIPIDVANNQPALKSNGELKTGPDGQRVISMPADEN